MRQEKAESAGKFIGAKISAKFRKAARQARKRRAVLKVSEPFKIDLINDVVRLAVAAYVREYNEYGFTAALSLAYMRPRNLYDINLGDLQRRFMTRTGRPLRRSIEKLEDQLNASIRQINRTGKSEMERVKLLNKRLDSLGLTTDKPGITQVWLRTSLGVAVGNARWDATQADPGVWGYTYVTMRDDRVRPKHAALDTYTRKKDDPQWEIIWPPSGWNCRCQAVPVEKQRQSRKKYNLENNVDEEFIGIQFD